MPNLPFRLRYNASTLYVKFFTFLRLVFANNSTIRHGAPIGKVAIMLALVASIGGFIFGYDTGQISDILLMNDFKLRFAMCSNAADASTCEFSTVRAGLIVSLLSIGTLAGALIGAP